MLFKKINLNETIFHFIQIDISTYVLYDSEFDCPIVYGSKNKVATTVKNLKPNIRINYYQLKNECITVDKIYDKRKKP
jgi:hypothetical protein